MAQFEMPNVKSGTHSVEVVDVVFGARPLDRARSNLTASIEVK
jgi:hypothetical protein